MTRRTLMLIAGLGSAALLAAAFGFQVIGGYLPCQMCLWQRWPHVAAIFIAAVGALLPARAIAALGGLTMIGNAGLGIFHTGVERDWWEGPQSCASVGGGLEGQSGADLLNFDQGFRVVLCDEAAWHFLGLSMASWNAIFCLVLAAIWFAAFRARQSA
ncbi:disulfide bond formation protein B [Rhodobacterales bacterium HKCCE2091]|nr:disulfide bond formation protein B [Rhodobacterales bacterium HKCCE2091]